MAPKFRGVYSSGLRSDRSALRALCPYNYPQPQERPFLRQRRLLFNELESVDQATASGNNDGWLKTLSFGFFHNFGHFGFNVETDTFTSSECLLPFWGGFLHDSGRTVASGASLETDDGGHHISAESRPGLKIVRKVNVKKYSRRLNRFLTEKLRELNRPWWWRLKHNFRLLLVDGFTSRRIGWWCIYPILLIQKHSSAPYSNKYHQF